VRPHRRAAFKEAAAARAAARLFYRPDLEPGAVLKGPALILDDYATVLVLPGFQAQAQTQGHL
jgi:N-methylhydantoinase A/oxoprolinase/acetone carboxylase beta subunit